MKGRYEAALKMNGQVQEPLAISIVTDEGLASLSWALALAKVGLLPWGSRNTSTRSKASCPMSDVKLEFGLTEIQRPGFLVQKSGEADGGGHLTVTGHAGSRFHQLIEIQVCRFQPG